MGNFDEKEYPIREPQRSLCDRHGQVRLFRACSLTHAISLSLAYLCLGLLLDPTCCRAVINYAHRYGKRPAVSAEDAAAAPGGYKEVH